ncbi:hypothetical protein EMCG_09452 [[Emmonsia] crescens]|uniref:Uncharacterized protein n=1 Tax=[Emmonsia] crescens TaxID=73230 RepID=A0A0G2J328_9EURO|nr:hypothetical protein EMCG_09452 [Emmonsia crescens UAMH 3008]
MSRLDATQWISGEVSRLPLRRLSSISRRTRGISPPRKRLPRSLLFPPMAILLLAS